MKYKEFINIALEEMNKDPNARYMVIDKPLNNGLSEKSLVQIRHADPSLSMAIALKPLYQAIKDGEITLEKSLFLMHQTFSKAEQEKRKITIPDFDDFSKNRPRIFGRLINAERNQNLLSSIPHRIIADNLAICYSYLCETSPGQTATTMVRNDLMHIWDTDEEELYELAMENTQQLFPEIILSVADIVLNDVPEEIRESMRPLVPDFMYVVTNQAHINGSFAILYPEVQRKIEEIFDGEYLLVPSSIHEMMAFPVDSMPIEDMKEMVSTINKTELLPMEYLSDDIYAIRDGQLINVTNEYERDDPDLE